MELRGTWNSLSGVGVSCIVGAAFDVCFCFRLAATLLFILQIGLFVRFSSFFFDRKLPTPPFLTRSIGGTVGIPGFAQDSPIYLFIFSHNFIYLVQLVHAVAFGGLVGACMWGWGWGSGLLVGTHIGNTMVTVNEKMSVMGAAAGSFVDCMDNNNYIGEVERGRWVLEE
jgi:hypothetical protein